MSQVNRLAAIFANYQKEFVKYAGVVGGDPAGAAKLVAEARRTCEQIASSEAIERPEQLAWETLRSLAMERNQRAGREGRHVIPYLRTGGLRLTMQMVFATRRWRALLDEALRPLGQSAARMEALSTIALSPPWNSQIEIAKNIGIEGATLTRMLDALEMDGLVERLPHPSDRRTKTNRLTDAGWEALSEIMAVAHGMRTRLLEGVNESSIDAANEFLDMLLGRLNEDLLP